MSNTEKIIIVVLGNWSNVPEGWKQIHNKIYENCKTYNKCVNHEILTYNSRNTNYHFVVFNEDTDPIGKEVVNFINGTTNKQFAIAVHYNSNKLDNVSIAVNNLGNVYTPKSFSRLTDDQIWKALNALLECICKSCGNYDILFNKLWQCLVPTSIDIAHSLRSQILTPFIPFHLYCQINNEIKKTTDDKKKSEWTQESKQWKEEILEICYAEIKRINNNKILEEFFKVAGKSQNELPELFNHLSNGIDDFMKIDLDSCITTFANDLEEVVNLIESGDQI